MRLPTLLQNLLQADQTFSAFTLASTSRIETHINSNRMEFFPEYTDHSSKHIEETLQTACDLATETAASLLTSADAAVFTVAVGLHDLGMHITKDGLLTLIQNDSPWRGVSFFDKKTWADLWSNFYAEATRFDGRKLRQLFGEKYRPVRPLPRLDDPWEDFDYLLAGEFVRRNHPRLAHEIALYGLPSKNGATVQICPINSDESRFFADIAGVVARSHGMDLRPCLDYLQDKYSNKINPRRVHAAFLSALLRISDYFQIQASRAPSARTDVSTFRSPLSGQEWKVHQSVTDIHNTSNDPEALVIIAHPEDVETFLKLKTWLNGLQKELDQSWAVLGEIFGLQTHNNLNAFGLKIRRIKSNIDDAISFAKTVDYIPSKISFEAANSDLLKLLVAPLYGNDPSIAIRELIQNAVDAVRELNDLKATRPELPDLQQYEQDADVTLSITVSDNNTPTEVTIIDRGTGMTAEIVQDYFLKAGASFRNSNAWKEEHQDGQGHSRVLRSGRFGVGALAAFLIGDELEVTTRHLLNEPDQGLTFVARLDSESISVNRATCPIGTKIRIKVPLHKQDSVESLLPKSWETEIGFDSKCGIYFLKQPSLSRSLSNKRFPKIGKWLPQPEEGTSEIWRAFQPPDFEKVFWTYDFGFPSLSCNGIVVTKDVTQKTMVPFLRVPKLSVFDRDGLLPLNLQRTGLTEQTLPFNIELLRSLAEDIAAHGAIEAPHACHDWFKNAYEGYTASYENIYFPFWGLWIVGRENFTLNEPNLLETLMPQQLIIGFGGDSHFGQWGETIRKSLPDNSFMAAALRHVFSDSSQSVKGTLQRIIMGFYRPPFRTKITSITTHIPVALIDKIKGLRPGKSMQRLIEKLEDVKAENGWISLIDGQPVTSFAEIVHQLPIDPENLFVIQVQSYAPATSGEISEIFGQDKELVARHDNSIEQDKQESLPLMQRFSEIYPDLVIPLSEPHRSATISRIEKIIPDIVKARKARLEKAKQRELKRISETGRKDI